MRSSISGHARWVDHVSKMSDVHAEHAPGTLMDPTDQWGALGAHTSSQQRVRAACAWDGLKGV